MENSREMPLKTKNRTTLWSSNPTTGHTPRENNNFRRHMCPSVHSSATHDSYYREASSTEARTKKIWCIHSHKRNKIGWFEVTWMDLESVIQSEVSQKEKHKYCILMHICGIEKNGIDDLICKPEIETQT